MTRHLATLSGYMSGRGGGITHPLLPGAGSAYGAFPSTACFIIARAGTSLKRRGGVGHTRAHTHTHTHTAHTLACSTTAARTQLATGLAPYADRCSS